MLASGKIGCADLDHYSHEVCFGPNLADAIATNPVRVKLRPGHGAAGLRCADELPAMGRPCVGPLDNDVALDGEKLARDMNVRKGRAHETAVDSSV
jgi:hypothetical protein